MTRTVFYLLVFLSAFTVKSSAQTPQDLQCDPETQYADASQCCRMCPPGRRKLPGGTCGTPVCEECGQGEYQDKYNTEGKCKRQPYCDPNKNFQVPVHENKTAQRICTCKQGFHCSSKECITCNPHSPCDPGQGVLSPGNQLHDTVCHPCPNGTYSDQKSIEEKCVKWKECSKGHHMEQIGTDRSDIVCAEDHRLHISLLIAAVVFGGLLVVVVIFIYFGKSRNKPKLSVNNDPETPEEKKAEPDVTPCLVSTPVEDDEVSSEDHGMTENGNCVTQEFGKPEKLSRQESQQSSSYTMLVSL